MRAELPGETRVAVLSLLEAGDLRAAAARLAPAVESRIGRELGPDLEFALCAVMLSSAAESSRE